MYSPLLPSSSQTTLVDPQPTTLMTLSKKSVINTTLYLDGNPYLSISTVDATAALTTIKDLRSNEILVKIKRRTFRSDEVWFSKHYDGATLKIKSWLEEGTLENGYPKWTVRSSSGSFIWRKDTILRLVLCPEHDLDHPIAWLQQGAATEPFGLNLKKGTEKYWDEVIAAFVILEQRMRVKEKEMSNDHGTSMYGNLLGIQVDTGSFNRPEATQ